MIAPIALLGPQRHRPMVGDVLARFGWKPEAGAVAAVTAGWEERETEDLELEQHLACEVHNLELWQRGEDVFGVDPDLFHALQERHDRIRKIHELYRLRLQHLSPVARHLLSQDGEEELLEPEREAAVEDLRRLDRHLLQRIAMVHHAFLEKWNPTERESVRKHRDELRELLGGVGALCIAGGHAGILLSRMRLFDILGLWDERAGSDGVAPGPLVAWSAGAMVLTDRIVLFHDNPPDGEGHAAEVLEPGFGRCPDIVPLPHAKDRLDLEDPGRVARFARRFGPAPCVPLDEGCGVLWDGASYEAWNETCQLMMSGAVEVMR